MNFPFRVLFILLFFSNNLFAVTGDSVVVKSTHSTWNPSSSPYKKSGLEIDSFQAGRIIYKANFQWRTDSSKWSLINLENSAYDSLGRIINQTVSDNYSNTMQAYSYDSIADTVHYYKWDGSGWVYNINPAMQRKLHNINGRDSIDYFFVVDSNGISLNRRIKYIYNSSDSLIEKYWHKLNGVYWQELTHNYFHYYYFSSGVMVLDTLYQAGAQNYFNVATRREYDISNNLTLYQLGYWSTPGSVQNFTYTCGNKLQTTFTNTGNDTKHDSVFYDNNCIPRFETHHEYQQHSKTFYYYPSVDTPWIDSPDTITICGNDTAHLKVLVLGGTSPLSIQWSPATFNDTLFETTALPAVSTIYTATISDANGLIGIRTIYAKKNPSPVAYVHLTGLDTSGCSTATLQVDSIPGTAVKWFLDSISTNYISYYKWTIDVHRNGMYYATTYNTYCTFTDSIRIDSLVHTTPDVTLNRICNQLIAFAPGAAEYKWFKNNVVMNGENNDTLNIAESDYYFVEITDSSGCVSRSRQISVVPKNILTWSTSACSDTCNGTASVGNMLTSPVVSVLWSNGDSTFQLSGLCPGNYIVSVTDSAGCSSTDTVTIQPQDTFPLDLHASTVNPGQCEAVATIAGSGSQYFYTYKYTYLWDDGSTNFFTDSLCLGWHYVTITNSLHCSQLDSVYVGTRSLTDSCSVKENIRFSACPDPCKDFVYVGPETGWPVYFPLTYVWPDSNMNKLGMSQYLCPDDYRCILIDRRGCSDTLTFTIPDRPFSYDVDVVYFDPADSCNTEVQAVFQNYQPQQITWCNGDTGSNAHVCPGNCMIEVFFGLDCQKSYPFSVNVPYCGLYSKINKVSCNGFCDGSIDITASAKNPFHFLWNTGDTVSSLNNLCAGTYTLYFSDDSICTDTMTIVLDDPPALTSSFVSSYNCNQCVSRAQIIGGVPPYSISWDGVQDTVYRQCENSYVIIQDKNGCIIQDSLLLNPPEPLRLFAEVTDATCHQCLNGIVTLTATGGTPPYTYSDFPPIEHLLVNTFYDLPYGNYHLCVIDSNNCSFCDFIQVSVNEKSADNALGLIILNSVTTKSIYVEINYPPANQQLYYEIVDVNGRVLIKDKITKQPFEIYTGNYGPGEYILLIETKTEILQQKKFMVLK